MPMGDLSLFGSLTAGRIRRLLPCLALVVLAGCGSHQHSFARSNRRPRTPECNGVFTHTTLFQPYEKRLVGVGGRSLGNHRHYLRVSQESFSRLLKLALRCRNRELGVRFFDGYRPD
ncbi:hypothetical protein GFM44_39475, partial [Rhizobium leguminosarum bv. viciae]|nr:hypothetical protein [Rhizobium leguminosarum bv. viciae]